MPTEDKRRSFFKSLLYSTSKVEAVKYSHAEIFGIPLENIKDDYLIVDEYGKIPKFLGQCLDCIECNSDSEGVFRISASVKDLEAVKTNINRNENINFTNGQEHIAAALVKLFLRDLPVPLLGFEANHLIGESDELKEYIKNMPVMSRTILYRVLKTLRKISEDKDQNKMNISNLSVILGPNLLWSIDNVTGERINTQAATKLAFILIQNFFTLYDYYDSQNTSAQIDSETIISNPLNENESALSKEILDRCIPTEFDKTSTTESKLEDSFPSDHLANIEINDQKDDIEVIISAIYDLQRQVFEMKNKLDEEQSRRIALEEFVFLQFKSIEGTIFSDYNIDASISTDILDDK